MSPYWNITQAFVGLCGIYLPENDVGVPCRAGNPPCVHARAQLSIWNDNSSLTSLQTKFGLGHISLVIHYCYIQPRVLIHDSDQSSHGSISHYGDASHTWKGFKSPVEVHKREEALQFFSRFQNNSYRIIKKEKGVDLFDISSVW